MDFLKIFLTCLYDEFTIHQALRYKFIEKKIFFEAIGQIEWFKSIELFRSKLVLSNIHDSGWTVDEICSYIRFELQVT